MPSTIYKYPIPGVDLDSAVLGERVIAAPFGLPLSAAVAGGEVVLYIEHTEEMDELFDFHVIVAGTGREVTLPENSLFVNTVVTPHGMVWHIYIFNIVKKDTVSCGELHILDS